MIYFWDSKYAPIKAAPAVVYDSNELLSSTSNTNASSPLASRYPLAPYKAIDPTIRAGLLRASKARLLVVYSWCSLFNPRLISLVIYTSFIFLSISNTSEGYEF